MPSPPRTVSPQPLPASQSVIFFPTCAHLDGDGWRLPIHGWIFRPAELSHLRRAAFRVVKGLARLRFPGADLSSPLLRQRLGSFLNDNERRHRVTIELAGQRYRLKRSRPDGHFKTTLALPRNVARDGEWLPFRAVLGPGDARRFEGRAAFLGPAGLSVISDIDDTIKVTQVKSRRKMLRNTFLKEFEAVPRMAALYQHWALTHRAAFHYVSAGPWHLYPFLSEFLMSSGFPAGTFHMRDFRLWPHTLPAALASPRRTKYKRARELFAQYPGRRFFLVGDSGERDAELYARLARKFPQQVAGIFIRNITKEGCEAVRWKKAFGGLSPKLWQVFEQAEEIG